MCFKIRENFVLHTFPSFVMFDLSLTLHVNGHSTTAKEFWQSAASRISYFNATSDCGNDGSRQVISQYKC